MIKILVITTVEIGYDGLTNHIFSYIENIDKKDCIIDLVSARGIDNSIKDKLDTIGLNSIYRLEYRDSKPIAYFWELRKLIQKNKYDIVHVHGNSATLTVDLMAAYMAGCKIRIAHSHNSKCQHKVFDFVLRPIFNLSYTHGFACGKEAGNWMFGKKNFYIIPNGKKIMKYLYNSDIRKQYRSKLKLDTNIIALGNVAAFVRKKNHNFLLKVFHLLVSANSQKEYRLYLFGINGETLSEIEMTIKNLKLQDKVFIMGTVDNIEDYLQAMDIMLLPSLYEGLPVSVIEWQISGLPCILSNTITQECKILDNVHFLPITQGEKVWVDEIQNLNVSSYQNQRAKKEIIEIFKNAGFDIEENAKMLKNLYIQFYKENGCGK